MTWFKALRRYNKHQEKYNKQRICIINALKKLALLYVFILYGTFVQFVMHDTDIIMGKCPPCQQKNNLYGIYVTYRKRLLSSRTIYRFKELTLQYQISSCGDRILCSLFLVCIFICSCSPDAFILSSLLLVRTFGNLL